MLKDMTLIDKLRKLAMHETMHIDSQTEVMRVIGGLLYITTVKVGSGSMAGFPINKSVASTFVKFDPKDYILEV